MIQIDDFLNRSVDDLYTELGFELAGTEVGEDGAVRRTSAGAIPPSPKKARENGIAIFQTLNLKINRTLCEEWDACAKIQNDFSNADPRQLVVVVSDVLSAVFLGIPVVIISAIVVKIGIHKFCDCPSTS
ncbi:MAG: hypothetical protein AAGK67_17490 [Pseudomonadota bacterium]